MPTMRGRGVGLDQELSLFNPAKVIVDVASSVTFGTVATVAELIGWQAARSSSRDTVALEEQSHSRVEVLALTKHSMMPTALSSDSGRPAAHSFAIFNCDTDAYSVTAIRP